MELATLLEALDRILNRSRILVGFGVDLEETQIPIIRIGTDKGTVHNLLAHVFLLETMMLWTPWWSVKPQRKRKKRNITTPVDVSTVENKVTSRVIVPANLHVLELFK